MTPQPVRLLLATTNSGKVREILPVFASLPVEFVSLDSLGSDDGFEETGETFEENAAAKALHYNKLYNLPAVADDSGLVVDALDGKPGIHSSRFLGEDTDYVTKMGYILEQLEDLPPEKRTAHFACSLVFVIDGEVYCTISKRAFGFIASEPAGSNGFGYDPIFFSDDLQKTFGQAGEEEKSRVSHRGKAVRTLASLFETHAALRARLGLDSL